MIRSGMLTDPAPDRYAYGLSSRPDSGRCRRAATVSDAVLFGLSRAESDPDGPVCAL